MRDGEDVTSALVHDGGAEFDRWLAEEKSAFSARDDAIRKGTARNST